ncbi:MAG TPA: mercury methylation corrinoid protein HgcA [Feifaniaceae bacterium]|nr:mercury methylation corrinoid protein HgcA [Feifaniaceae bacterium]
MGYVGTSVGEVPRVSAKLSSSDILGSWKCRWSIGRMDYAIDPGLYCVGNPDAQSPVLVTANYKMTFDRLRKELTGLDAWIVVLDTDGINVWCAAGKGTFGTGELVRRLKAVKLMEVVSHRTVILPQLGATGVAAHEVVKRSGFRVMYGPIRARDLKSFLAAGMRATDEMRTMRFTLWDRLVLTPVEFVAAIKPAAIVFGVMFILNAIGLGHYGLVDLYALLGAIFAGAVLAPALLPWIPGRAFSFKGFLVGLLWAAIVNVINGFPAAPEYGWFKAAAYVLILPALSAFLTMNFTGSSTYTSLSGVDKEMRIALPAMLLSTGIGIILMLVGDFIRVFG